MRLLLKHAVAAGVVVAGSVALTVATYFALLLWAILNDGGLGGPLTLPGMVIVALVASVAAVLFVLLPVTALAEALCARAKRWRWIGEMIVSSAILIVYVFAAGVGIALARGAEPRTAAIFGASACAAMLLLLGAYWWSLKAADVLLALAARAYRRLTAPGRLARSA